MTIYKKRCSKRKNQRQLNDYGNNLRKKYKQACPTDMEWPASNNACLSEDLSLEELKNKAQAFQKCSDLRKEFTDICVYSSSPREERVHEDQVEVRKQQAEDCNQVIEQLQGIEKISDNFPALGQSRKRKRKKIKKRKYSKKRTKKRTKKYSKKKTKKRTKNALNFIKKYKSSK